MDTPVIAVVGLGYVGLPLALALAEHFSVIGYDASTAKISAYRAGRDPARETSDAELQTSTMMFTDDPCDIRGASVYIVAVPTPIDDTRRPDLSALRAATAVVTEVLAPDDLVIFESTVYPGVTEEICVPILEGRSRRVGVDFDVGYSPERINPGDAEHVLRNVRKIVAGHGERALRRVGDIYAKIVDAPLHYAPSIRVAEAAKVLENVQRDLNIALVNELALIFARDGLDTHAVVDAAASKWNFVPYRPGLVGGHCIAVDPYYLTHYAEKLGYHPEVMLAGRRVNDAMGRFVARAAIRKLCAVGKSVSTARVAVLGVTFKEDVSDIRNSRVADLVAELEVHGVRPQLLDPLADSRQVEQTMGHPLAPLETLSNVDVVIVAVRHRAYAKLRLQSLRNVCTGAPILMDVRRTFERAEAEALGFDYWSL